MDQGGTGGEDFSISVKAGRRIILGSPPAFPRVSKPADQARLLPLHHDGAKNPPAIEPPSTLEHFLGRNFLEASEAKRDDDAKADDGGIVESID